MSTRIGSIARRLFCRLGIHRRRAARELASSAAAALVLTACGPLKLDDAEAMDAGKLPFDASVVLSEFETGDAAFSPKRPPNLRITSPASGSGINASTVRIEGTADDDRGIASVSVRVGPNQPVFAQTGNDFRSWYIESVAPVGAFEVLAVARDLDAESSPTAHISLTRPSSLPDDAAPAIVVESPANGSSPLHPLALVRGTASDDRAVVAIEVRRNGELLSEREVETDDLFARWSRLVPLIAGEQNELVFTARDGSGHETRATLTLQGRATTDRLAPTLTLSAPVDQLHVATPTLGVSGSARDDVGVREVKVRIGRTPAGSSTVVWGDYQVVETRDGFASFGGSFPAPSGAFRVEVRAIDLNGLTTSITRNVTSDFVSDWSEEATLPLRLHALTPPPLLNFALTRTGIDQVFTEAIQRDIRLLELDTTALITDAVDQIKQSCGVRWRENNPNPRHDCSATDYGKDRSPPIPWQQTPEFSMVRLLTMTPANVVVTGTSLENLQGLADALGIGGGFHDILADTMGVPATQEIVSTPSVVRALQEFWMQAHPEVLPGAKLPISLYDAMHELSPLSDRYGPSGGHPGLLDPAFPVRSELLTPSFEMRLGATSNLRWMDGIDAGGSAGVALKDYIALVVDSTGPTLDDVLEFDFNDPARFDVVGLVGAPRADMRMLLRENAAYVRTCVANDNTCKNNLPAAPAPGYVWANPRWQIESVVAAAAYYQYQNRSAYSRTYNLLIVPAATVTVGLAPNPPGWSTFETLINLGDPPPPQYLWETISEVGQVALHDTGSATLPEGGVNVAFSLKNVNVGLSADGIRTAMRPRLQEQRHKLSDQLLGDYAKNNGAVDFYYRRGADDAPYLFFVAASDPRPGASYGYLKPGFFADPELTNKLSNTAAGSSGDSAHEKLALPLDQTTTVYMSDDTGQLARLRFVVGRDPSEIEVLVAKRVR
jgi:hypothetical protein